MAFETKEEYENFVKELNTLRMKLRAVTEELDKLEKIREKTGAEHVRYLKLIKEEEELNRKVADMILKMERFRKSSEGQEKLNKWYGYVA